MISYNFHPNPIDQFFDSLKLALLSQAQNENERQEIDHRIDTMKHDAKSFDAFTKGRFMDFISEQIQAELSRRR